MDGAMLLGAALLLSLERICYVWISRAPRAFRAWCGRSLVRRYGAPVDIVRYLFTTFKLLQVAVFLGWCYVFGGGSIRPANHSAGWLALGVSFVVAGQVLSALVFLRLGPIGVFYGNRLGYSLPWCTAFPFGSMSHPQYVGALLSVWGFFLIMRFPHPDWYVLPGLETVYYAAGARLER